MNPISLSDPKKRVLMISYPFFPNPSAGAVRSGRFARYLTEYGWRVDVVTIKPQVTGNQSSEFICKGVNVHRTDTLDPWLNLSKSVPENIILRAIRSILMKIFSFPDHMLLWLPFALKKGLDICEECKINAIYTTSPPHSTQIIGYLLSKMTGIPWVSDFRDPWTLNAYKDMNRVDNLLLQFSALIENAVYKKADVILVNTLANRQKMVTHFPMIPEKKIIYLPNGWEPFGDDIYRGNRNDKDCLTIVHAGTFYPRFKPYALFHALSCWKKRMCGSDFPDYPDNRIQVILLGSNDPITKQLLEELDLQNIVQIRKWVKQEEAWRNMCQADILLATLGTGEESATYIPSKLFEYIAAKRPIIGFFPEGVACDLIRDTQTGVVFTSDDPLPVIRFLNSMIVQKESAGIPYTPNAKVVQFYHIRNRVQALSDIFSVL